MRCTKTGNEGLKFTVVRASVKGEKRHDHTVTNFKAFAHEARFIHEINLHGVHITCVPSVEAFTRHVIFSSVPAAFYLFLDQGQ